jgi:hypothetical protein
MNKGMFGMPPGENNALVWITPSPLLNSWVVFDTSWPMAAYAKDDRTGLVYLRGLIKSGTISTTLPIFILPFGYRPMYQHLFPTLSNAAIGRLDVNSLGLVIPSAGNNTYFSLNGVVFDTNN